MMVSRSRNDEMRAQIMRVRVALLSCSLVGASAGGVKVRSVSSEGSLASGESLCLLRPNMAKNDDVEKKKRKEGKSQRPQRPLI
jgi:hypothetical protein